MPKNNEIDQLTNGEVADANVVNQIVLNAGNEAGAIPYSEDDHQRDTLGSESLGNTAYPWGDINVSRDASLNEIDTVSHTVANQVAIKDLRKFIKQKDTPDSYSGEAGKIVGVNTGEDALEFINPPTKSTTLFNFAKNGSDQTAGANGVIAYTDILETPVTGNILADDVWVVKGNSYLQVLETKMLKLAGVSTVTIYCKIWQLNSNVLYLASCRCTIGSATPGTVTTTAAVIIPAWLNFTVDVSGLTNGNVYDVVIDLKHSQTDRGAYMDSIIAFGS